MLYLQELAEQEPQHRHITLSERLPSFILAPCALDVKYQVETKDNFYLINLVVSGDLTVVCQRCMQEFHLNYKNATTIAVARSEERAEQLLELYECIVASNWQVSLEDIIIDELYLYAPQFHEDFNDCDDEINQLLIEKSESD